MELVYRSTRNAQETATASMAILKGLANEGGLFVPDTIPAFDKSWKSFPRWITVRCISGYEADADRLHGRRASSLYQQCI